MSTSRPVPGYRFPNWAVVYQSVCQAVAGLRSIASRARSLLSPGPPEDPNADALAGVSARSGAAAGVVTAGADAAGVLPIAVAGAEAARPARWAAAGCRPAEGAAPPPGLASRYPANPSPPTSATPSATAQAGQRRRRWCLPTGVTGPAAWRLWRLPVGWTGSVRRC